MVNGALPRPDNELEITLHVKHLNDSTAKSCKQIKDQQKLDIMFIGGYKLFLECFKYYKEAAQGYKTTVHVVRPLQIFFVFGSPLLNEMGVDKLYNYVLQRLNLPHPRPDWVDMPVKWEEL